MQIDCGSISDLLISGTSRNGSFTFDTFVYYYQGPTTVSLQCSGLHDLIIDSKDSFLVTASSNPTFALYSTVNHLNGLVSSAQLNTDFYMFVMGVIVALAFIVGVRTFSGFSVVLLAVGLSVSSVNAYNTEYVVDVYQGYDSNSCYSSSSECSSKKTCGSCEYNSLIGYCWPGISVSQRQALEESYYPVGSAWGEKEGTWMGDTCDDLRHVLEFITTPITAGACGSRSKLQVRIGQDEWIYQGAVSSSNGVWTVYLVDYRNNEVVQYQSIDLQVLNSETWEFQSTGYPVLSEFPAQTFVDESEKGKAYAFKMVPTEALSCWGWFGFSVYDWYVERNCAKNQYSFLLYDYDWYNYDNLETFEYKHFEDRKGSGSLVHAGVGSYGFVSGLSGQYKYRIDYVTPDGIAYDYDFVPVCSFAESEGAAVGSYGVGLTSKGVGMSSQGVGVYEVKKTIH